MKIEKIYNSIDLFCGAGGLSLGFQRAGFKTLFAVEFNKIYAQTYKANFPEVDLYCGDIKNISNIEIENLGKKAEVDIIIGGPPCQGFSLAGNIGRLFLEDERNRLFLEYFRFVDILKPRMFVLENVASMVTHNKGKTIKEIEEKFHSIGYEIQYKILNAVNYNVPQERRRVFIVGTQKGISFKYPLGNSNIITIKEAIGNLPELKSGEISSIPQHNAMKHSAQMLEKMSFVKDGGTRKDIPESLRPTSGDIRKYVRYNSNKPSFCVTGDMRKIFHYSQNRALTCRELARIQTFPDDYIFCGSTIEIQQQIGNAVPCNLAYEVALECFRSLKNE
ncbi:MAG: DNA cytosine methyltransferase [Ruminococcaceae bacterium]|nr:DNA cytosine methyltransferase [Oscillospiraceae bacterium]